MTRSERHARLLAEAAFIHGVKPADIMGRSRDWKVVRARRQMMTRYREAGYTLPRIAAIFGRHHTTVMAAIRVETNHAR